MTPPAPMGVPLLHAVYINVKLLVLCLRSGERGMYACIVEGGGIHVLLKGEYICIYCRRGRYACIV